ncbi:hypothetical protein DH2020_013632 [Rehmannia glutinosa]|uniref:S-adenosylmethionine-dependent methyltransferase n=1 Tax=Rehmannia glutinosa TaxID=99300 RepID=A0ABR0X3X1_REHGL
MDSINVIAMAGGDGIQSYTNNSSFQKMAIGYAKSLIQKSIVEYIQPMNPPTSVTFRVADLGCSVGPNTFIAVDNILEAVKLKYLNTNHEIPDFQVYFSDHAINDFNTLFKSLPPNREYYASGVPGSFHTRLFPRASLHIVHCSYSIHWLSQLPREITDKNSRVWNKGKIHYVGAGEEVINAYSRQHAIDFSKFLDVRAQEIVPGGLIMLILPARPNGVPHSQDPFPVLLEQLGECLMDLARKGVIDEEKVDAFNVPCYFSSPQELEQVINQNGRFNIEMMESLPKIKVPNISSIPQRVCGTIRAVTEELIKEHFGREILDEVFGLFQEKIVKALEHIRGSDFNLFMLLKLKEETYLD